MLRDNLCSMTEELEEFKDEFPGRSGVARFDSLHVMEVVIPSIQSVSRN